MVRAFLLILLLVALGVILITPGFRQDPAHSEPEVMRRETQRGGVPGEDLIPVKPLPSEEPLPSRVEITPELITAGDINLRKTAMPLARMPQSTGEPGSYPSYRDEFGIERSFAPGRVLVKLKDAEEISVLNVATNTELTSLAALRNHTEIEFAELDAVMKRQFESNDPERGNQWHHEIIGSSNAWNYTRGNLSVQVAIVDTPFQMDHPDLAGQAVPGWNMIANTAVTSSPGHFHSTIGAGMAGAVIDNFVGVAGAANCQLMPLDIGDFPAISDMYKAIRWAADHGVRVVNVSWDGAYSSTLDQAGQYLREKTRGMLIMAGINGERYLNYPARTNIWAISMTDAEDRQRSAHGNHIDFAAPGYEIFSTTTNSTYEIDSGTSYAAPLFSGIVAYIMSLNPALGPEEIETILKASVVDLGPDGWDQYFGWGRIDFGKVAENTFKASPISRLVPELENGFTVVVDHVPGVNYTLFRSVDLAMPQWEEVGTAIVTTNGIQLRVSDPDGPTSSAFYRLQIQFP